MNLIAIPLHQDPSLIPLVAEILNLQWPRSLASRIVSLEKSNSELPLNIVLLEINELGLKKVVGHASLARVLDESKGDAVFIENVVVIEERRGRGYGRILMQEIEKIAMEKGVVRTYLSTNDKQDFYSHLGYLVCSPIVVSGPASNKLLSSDRMKGILHIFGGKSNLDENNNNSTSENNNNKTNNNSDNIQQSGVDCDNDNNQKENPSLIIKPPPLPQKMKMANKILAETWMTKELKG